MRLDMIASERHFVDHLAPIWHALPEDARGTFMTHHAYVAHARKLGIEATNVRVEGSNPVLVASWGDTRHAMAMRRQIARIEHGIGQSYGGDPISSTHPSYPGGSGAERVGLFLVPNAQSAGRWQRAYPRASVAIVGSPKLDEVPVHVPNDQPVVVVSFHFDASGVCHETRTSFFAYQKAVAELAKTREVIGHCHPRIAGIVSRWCLKNGLPFLDDFRDVLQRADLYVCDNSSTLYEFAATGRPVVVLNRPVASNDQGYRRNVNHGLRFWEAADVGVQVDDPKDLGAAVDLALLDGPEQQANREEALSLVYAHRTGAAQRAADVLTEWVASLSPVRVPAVNPARAALAEERARYLARHGKAAVA
jgi:ribosomal protein L13E